MVYLVNLAPFGVVSLVGVQNCKTFWFSRYYKFYYAPTRMLCLYIIKSMYLKRLTPCSLVGAGAGLGWLVLIFCERETLLVG